MTTFRRSAALRSIGLWLAAGFLGLSCDDPVGAGGASPGAIAWDPSAVRQTIDGFGGSNAWHGLPSDPTAAGRAVELLFSPDKGIGLSLLRNRIPFRESTTYDDAFLAKDPGGRYLSTSTPAGHRTFQLQWSNWDLSNTKALLTKARALSTDLRVFSTPWTPPNNQYDRWKVDGPGNTVGGTQGTVATWPDIGGVLDPGHYQDYADVLADYAGQFAAQMGYPLAAISVQNEPNWLPKTYESCWWTADQIHAFLPVLASSWAAKGVKTPIIAPEGAQFAESLIVPTLADPATAGLVGIVGVHQYDSNASTGKLAAPWLSATKEAGKKLWVTEVSSSGADPASMEDGLWVAQLVHADLVAAEANAFCFWWLWSGDSPSNQGSLLGIAGTTVVAYKRLFVLGQYSRFVRPGWVRVAATAEPKPGVLVSAFRDPASKKFAVVVINTGASGTTVTLAGTPVASAELYRTSATEDLKDLGPLAVSGSSLVVPLTARSITTVAGTLGP